MDAHRILEIEAKTGIAKAMMAETFLVSLYRTLAPYRGCGHGCRYCDGRAEKYFVEGDFERDIAVRSNLPGLVANDVADGACTREWGAVCVCSGVTDVYQPLERERELTRKTLEALIPKGADNADMPLVILTKNKLILRDFDILARFPKVLIIVTVTTTDISVSGKLEPAASPPAKRLEVVRRAKEAGFFSGVMAMPLCPGITDTEESVRALFDAAVDAGADFVYPGGLTLRPGRQKELFVSTIGAVNPALLPLYEFVYRENRPSGVPVAEYALPLMKKWDKDLASRGIAQMIPHRVYRELLSCADSLFVLFCHMGHLYDMRGIDTRPLKSAVDRYAAWLKNGRSALRRKRASRVLEKFDITKKLDAQLKDLCLVDRGARPYVEPKDTLAFGDSLQRQKEAGLTDILGNAKLSELAARIVLDGAVFDYATLALVSE